MRLFVAIDISAAVRAALDSFQRMLKPTAKLNWSPVANLHITTKFIGEWPEERLPEMKSALACVRTHGPVEIRVTAEQFAWNIHYPGPDGKFGATDPSRVTPDNPLGIDRSDPNAKDDITSINQMNVPINKPVLVHLSSKDVIHSFGLYEMRVKQDAVPGIEQKLWFMPTQTGEWEIACSQLCGLGHYRMRGFYTIQTRADFDAWLKEQAAELNGQ